MKESEDTKHISELKFDIKEFAEVIKLVNNDELSSTNSKQVIEELFMNGGEAMIIVKENNLIQKNDTEALEKIVDEVLQNNSKQVEDFK
jgi:Asp-tRNA(Asn)/Glu-tRNA(Gln) amidotransferase B subunit